MELDNIYLDKNHYKLREINILLSKKEVSILLTLFSVPTLVLLFVEDEFTMTLFLDFLYFLKIMT